MAITIQNNPGAYQSVHGDMLFVVCDIVKASDPVTYPDYRYVCDIYIGSEMVARLKAYPRPDNKMGVFNVASIVRAYLAATFNPTGSQLRAQELGSAEFFIAATMKFGEEYNFTLYTNITVDSERLYFNHYNGRLLGITTQFLNLNYLNAPVTVRPLTTPVREDATSNFIPFFPTITDSITIEVKSYTKAGALIGTYSTGIAPSAINTLQLYNVSPSVINGLSPDLINPLIAGYYTVQFLTAAKTGEPLYRFNLVCEEKHEVHTLHFLNRFGGFESRDFTKVSRKVIDIEKSEFGKLGYVMDSSGVVSYKNANNVYEETRSVYSSQYKEKLTLNTDILTDEEYSWLGDLILSPMIFIEMVDFDVTYFIPAAITENNYEFKKRVNDNMTNLTISVEFGEQFNAQFR